MIGPVHGADLGSEDKAGKRSEVVRKIGSQMRTLMLHGHNISSSSIYTPPSSLSLSFFLVSQRRLT